MNESTGLGRSPMSRTPWNKGLKATPEARAKMSEAQRKRDPKTRNTDNCFVKGQVPFNKDKPMSPELRAKMEEAAWSKRRGTHDSEETRRKKSEGLKGYKRTEENCRNIGLGHKGKVLSPEVRHKLSVAHLGKRRGAENNKWKGGITPLARAIRTHYLYRQWRSDVFTRDDFTCRDCGIRGGRLHAHHSPLPFSDIYDKWQIKAIEDAENCAELWNINNGVTLCKDCHYKRHHKEV